MTGGRPTFRYRAARSDGRLERGRLGAENREAALAFLATQGLHPIELSCDTSLPRRRAVIPMAELGLGLRLLANLAEAGLPMGRALHVLETLSPPSFAAVLPEMRQSLREGQSLAQAFALARLATPPEVLGIIRAGERGSGLAAAIRAAAELCDETAATRAAIQSALAYPVLLASAGLASVGLLVGIVLPRFATILSDLGESLPATTRFVLAAATFAQSAALPLGLVALVVLILWRVWTANDEGKRQWHSLLLAMPLVGHTRAAAGTSRLCAAFAALLSSGVPVVPALGTASEATGDAALKARTLSARTRVEHGERLSAALAIEGAVTDTAQRLLAAGEETGNLAHMVAHAAKLERDHATRRVREAVRLIEPTLIIAFGGLIAVVAAALLQALYTVRPGA